MDRALRPAIGPGSLGRPPNVFPTHGARRRCLVALTKSHACGVFAAARATSEQVSTRLCTSSNAPSRREPITRTVIRTEIRGNSQPCSRAFCELEGASDPAAEKIIALSASGQDMPISDVGALSVLSASTISQLFSVTYVLLNVAGEM